MKITSNSKGVTLSKLTTFDRNAYPTSQAVWEAEVDIDIIDPFELDGEVMARPEATITWSKNVRNRRRHLLLLDITY